MEISDRLESNIVILTLNGRLDAVTSGIFTEKITAQMAAGYKDFVVDFTGLEYISSSGLRVFLLAFKRLSAVKGRIVFACLKDHIREVFDLAGFSPCFPMFPSVPEAAKSLSAPQS